VSKKRSRSKEQVAGFIGVGLDNQDGHERLTKSEYFFLVGGSAETHERMQDVAVKFTDTLHRRGKKLGQTSVEEVIDIMRESMG
jgi:hypothetical protein